MTVEGKTFKGLLMVRDLSQNGDIRGLNAIYDVDHLTSTKVTLKWDDILIDDDKSSLIGDESSLNLYDDFYSLNLFVAEINENGSDLKEKLVRKKLIGNSVQMSLSELMDFDAQPKFVKKVFVILRQGSKIVKATSFLLLNKRTQPFQVRKANFLFFFN